MKEIKEEAERHRKERLSKYGAEDHKACGGRTHRAHGGKVEHSDKAEDEKLLHKDLKPAAFKHRADGGPIANGSPSPRLGRARGGKAGKGKTNIAINMAKPNGDGPALPPPALGAGSNGPAPMPPKPIPPMAPPGPPMKKGGKVERKEHEKHGKHEKHESHEEKRHGHSGHRH